MKKMLFLVILIMLLAGCATEYYPPRDDEKQGAVKRKGFVPWSDGVGKNMPFSNISVIGK